MNLTFQLRRGSAAEWALSNRVLLAGEPGVETDTKKLKLGDGVTAWNSLPYVGATSVDLTAYYTKLEVDAILATYATDAEVAATLATYATDAEVAALLATYTSDAEFASAIANYYTKAEVYAKTETYTKAEVDALTGGGNPWEFAVEDYGALGNGKMVTDIGVTSGSGVLTSAGGNFAGAAVGQWVMVNTSDGSLIGQITSVASAPNQVTINTNSTITESSLFGVFGTDDVAAINSCIAAARTYAEANGYYAEVLLKDKIYIAGTRDNSADSYAGWNTQIKLLPPTSNNGRKLVLKLKGVGKVDHLAYWNATRPHMAGSVIVSMLIDRTGISANGWPSVIASPVPKAGMAGSVAPTFVNHKPIVEDLMVVMPYKSGVAALNLSYSTGCYVDGYAAICFATPLYGPGLKLNDWYTTFSDWDTAIRTPVAGSNADTTFGHLAFEGLNGGLSAASEHVTVQSIKAIYMGVVIPITQGGVGHGLTIDRVTAEAYQGGISNIDSTANIIQLNVGMWNTEGPTATYDFHDLGDAFRGEIFFSDSTGNREPLVDGCAKLRVINVNPGPREASQVGGLYPLSEYGIVAATAPIDGPKSLSTLSSLWLARVVVPAHKPITKLGIFISAGLTNPSANDKLVIYNSAGVKVGETAGSAVLWSTNNTWRFLSLVTPIDAKQIEQTYYVGWVVNDTTGGQHGYMVLPAGMTVGGNASPHRRSIFSSATTPPASFDPATYGTTADAYIPMIFVA